MSQESEPWREEPIDPQQGGQMYSQSLKHTSVGARLPEKVRGGIFATGTTILQTSDEFVIDFLSTMVPPQQVAARVVLTPNTFRQMIVALQTNLGRFQQQFGRLVPRVHPEQPAAPAPGASPEAISTGEPSELGRAAKSPHVESADTLGETMPYVGPDAGAMHPARPEPPQQPRVEDLYDQLKLPDEMLGGVYANVVMIRHTPEEFCLDFIANFYPRSVVTCRVFMTAGRVPSFLDAMQNAMSRYRPHPPQSPS